MDNIRKRILLFLTLCIGTRLFLALLAFISKKEQLPYLGFLFLIISFGFAIIYLFKLRQTGIEVFGEKIWWNNLRPVHAILYGLAGYYAINGNNDSGKIIFIDTIIGFFAFTKHHSLL